MVVFVGFFPKFSLGQCCSYEAADDCPVGFEPNDGQCQGGDQCCPCSDVICHCDTFTDECPGWVPSGNKCKLIKQKCGDIISCDKYQLCKLSNGVTQYMATPNVCHTEGETCYTNEMPCKNFSKPAWLLGDGDPSGSAYWEINKWNVGGCTYHVSDKYIEDLKCTKFTMQAMVDEANRYVDSVQAMIKYSVGRAYCGQCAPGYLPDIVVSPTSGYGGNYYTRPPDVDDNWGVIACRNQVKKPNYAPGCEIDFSKDTGELGVAECEQTCDDGMGTVANGATSATDCKVDETRRYCDKTGCFTLGNSICNDSGGG